MNASAEFLNPARPQSLFGVPVFDLGWNATLATVEGLVALRGSRTTLAFLDGSTLLRRAFDPDCRDRLERRMMLPSGGRALGLLTKAFYGKAAPVRFTAQAFIPALLTFFDRNRRIGIAGEDVARVEALRDHFLRHTPWHTILAVAGDHQADQRFDLVVVDAASASEERRIERQLASVRTGLVIMAGKDLSGLIAGNVGKTAASASVPASRPSFA